MIINVNYQFHEVSHTRCFEIKGNGNLSPVDCPSFDPPKVEQQMNPLLVGLGDTVAAVTTAAGIKPCGGCKKRQAALNANTPKMVRTLFAWIKRKYYA